MKMWFARAALVAAVVSGLAASGSAQAQWVWRDPNGRSVYSDVPPPPDIKPADILRRPSGAESLPGGDAARPAPAADNGQPPKPAAAPPRSIADQELDFRKRLQEREKAEKKQADDEALAARRAQDCERARGYLRS